MSDISNKIDDLVANFAAIGMTWADVSVAASLLHSKKIQEILISTFSSCSITELREIMGHAYARAQPTESSTHDIR